MVWGGPPRYTIHYAVYQSTLFHEGIVIFQTFFFICTKKNSGAHSRVATLIQPSFQKKKAKKKKKNVMACTKAFCGIEVISLDCTLFHLRLCYNGLKKIGEGKDIDC